MQQVKIVVLLYKLALQTDKLWASFLLLLGTSEASSGTG